MSYENLWHAEAEPRDRLAHLSLIHSLDQTLYSMNPKFAASSNLCWLRFPGTSMESTKDEFLATRLSYHLK